MKKDVSLQIIRIISCLWIILCHLVQETNNKYIVFTSQFFNVGVYIFLFLSGYLYGNKKIDNPIKWYCKRFIKLMIPIYIFLIPVFMIYAYDEIFEFKYIFIHLFNLKKIFGTGIGLEHLWFMTVIMFCYLITPILSKLKYKNYTIIILLVLISMFICYININLGQILLYMCTYIFGYIYKNKKEISFNNFLGMIMIFAIIAIRVLGRQLFDQTILYNQIIVSITHMILALLIILLIKKIVNNCKISNFSFINHLDSISYYVYICHYIFVVGPVRLVNEKHFILSSLCVIIVTYISALILQKLSNKVIAFTEKIKYFQ